MLSFLLALVIVLVRLLLFCFSFGISIALQFAIHFLLLFCWLFSSSFKYFFFCYSFGCRVYQSFVLFLLLCLRFYANTLGNYSNHLPWPNLWFSHVLLVSLFNSRHRFSSIVISLDITSFAVFCKQYLLSCVLKSCTRNAEQRKKKKYIVDSQQTMNRRERKEKPSVASFHLYCFSVFVIVEIGFAVWLCAITVICDNVIQCIAKKWSKQKKNKRSRYKWKLREKERFELVQVLMMATTRPLSQLKYLWSRVHLNKNFCLVCYSILCWMGLKNDSTKEKVCFSFKTLMWAFQRFCIIKRFI